MAAFACAMIEAPAIVWDPLSEKARQDFAAWFDTDGAAVPYGRSLTYRFAQSAFYAACLWAGLAPAAAAGDEGNPCAEPAVVAFEADL